MSYCTAYTFFYFEFDGNQVPSTRPGRLYLEGRIHGGACFWNFAVDMERFQTV